MSLRLGGSWPAEGPQPVGRGGTRLAGQSSPRLVGRGGTRPAGQSSPRLVGRGGTSRAGAGGPRQVLVVRAYSYGLYSYDHV